MRILVTRPEDDAGALAEALSAMGHEAVAAPLLDIRILRDEKIPDTPYQAVLITSANGARAVGARLEIARLKHVPVLAVGEASAAAARKAGFATVESAGGDASALAELALKQLEPGAGPLLHVAGSVSAGDLKGELEKKGFSVDRVTLYEAVPADVLPDAARDALKTGTVEGILFYSPRTARIFADLLRAEGLDGAIAPLSAFCLSPAVAEALQGLSFKSVRIAREPNQQALLDLLA